MIKYLILLVLLTSCNISPKIYLITKLKCTESIDPDYLAYRYKDFLNYNKNSKFAADLLVNFDISKCMDKEMQ